MSSTYGKRLTKAILSKKPFLTFTSGDLMYHHDCEYFLVRNGAILCHGHDVYSYPNKDYDFVDNERCTHLMRNGKLLYKSEPYYQIGVNCNKRSGAYNIYTRHGEHIKSVFFPSITSLLDVIDNKIKGESHENKL